MQIEFLDPSILEAASPEFVFDVKTAVMKFPLPR